MRERGVSVSQAARDLDLHDNVLRKWVREQTTDPGSAFPGHGVLKPEQQEIERLRRELARMKAAFQRDLVNGRRCTARTGRSCLRGSIARAAWGFPTSLT